jgi:large subunit ribosomal protein L18
MNKLSRNKLRLRRKKRVKVKGNKGTPRLSVFRSNKWEFLQLIDDEAGKTLIGLLSKKYYKKGAKKEENAFLAGQELGKQAIKKGIKKAVFDRGGYKYHGRVKKVLEGAEKEGLQFSLTKVKGK